MRTHPAVHLGLPVALPTLLAPLAVLAVLAPACGGTHHDFDYPSADSFPAAAEITLNEASTSSAVTELSARFYGAEGLDPAAFDGEIARLLEAHPGNATLHELAAEIALLRGDVDPRFEHLLRAAADTTSPLTALYLHLALDNPMTASQQSAAIALLREIRARHPDESARFAAANHLIDLLETRGELDDAREVTARLGTIDTFLLAGAFDNDEGKGFLEPYAPETGVDPSATMQGVLRELTWRDAALMDTRGRIALDDMVSPSQNAVAYLATVIRVPAAQDAQLRLSTSSPLRAWLGGRLVVSEETLDGGDVDDVIVPIELTAGDNLLLIKSANKRGVWYLGARITDARGRNLDGISFATRRFPSPAAVEAGATADPLFSLPDALADVTPAARRKVLESYYLDRVGREEPALAAAQAALEAAPGHPVTLYRAAMAHWDHGEMGRAADILNQGVESAGAWAHAFRWKRGRFYSQRDRYDRAVEDLVHVVEALPEARYARVMLARVFRERGFQEDRCKTLDALLERWPDSARGHRLLGACLNDRGYLDQAEQSFHRAHALEPGDGYTLGWLAHFDRLRGRWDAAIERRNAARAVRPESGALIVSAADTYREAGRRDEARRLYTLASERDPDWARPYARLATMSFEDGDTEAAIGSWQEALERNPDDSALAERLDYYRAGEGGARELMPTEEQIEEAIASVDGATPHPGAHTVWGLDDEVTMVRQDGSAQRMVTQVMRAVTTRGRDQLIRQDIPPNARILSAYVHTPDGTRQEASSIRGGTVRFRRLDVGATVVLQYVYDSQPRSFLPNHFVSDWWFSGFHRQSLVARWVVVLPPHRNLVTRVLGDIEHTEGEHDGMALHTFTARAVDPFVPEPGMIPPPDLLWHVSVSTLSTWDEYVNWERALLSEVFRGDAQLAALATRLTEGVTEPRARFDKLFHFVAEEIRYQQDYESTIAGVRPHSCPIVLERGYGDCKDKAVLLIRLAQEVGIDVNFAILRTRPRGLVERDVPNQQFNHAIVYVPTQDGIDEGFFIDPTTDGLDMGNLRQDDQGATSLVLDPRDHSWEFREIPYQAPDLRYLRHTIEVNVTGRDTATAEARLEVRGDEASNLRRRMRSEEEATIVLQSIANGLFDGSRLTANDSENVEDIWHPLALELDLDVSDSIRPEGNSHRIQIPQVTPLRGMTRLETRRTPMYLGPPYQRRLDVTYNLPRNARVVRVPDDVEVEHECFTVTQRTTRRGRSVRVLTNYEQRCPEVSIEQYPAYRQRAQRAAAALESEVVFDLR